MNDVSEKQRIEHNKLSKRLMRETGRAIGDYNMIEAGDRVMVCLSGGKDSYAMLDVLLTLRTRAPIDFPEGKTTCSLCSRLRRGILYRVAGELGATKIALGHHRDDILGTFFLNLFYGGKLKAMPPKLVSDDGKNTVIRPLAYIQETDLIAYADWKKFPIIPCTLCGSQENLKRKEVSRMLAEWDKKHPSRAWSIFNALANVAPSHLMDRNLFDFVGLKPNGLADPEGDMAFDPPSFETTTELQEASIEELREAGPSTLGANQQVMRFIKPLARA